MRKYKHLSDKEVIEKFYSVTKQRDLMSFNNQDILNKLEFDLCFLKSELINRKLDIHG